MSWNTRLNTIAKSGATAAIDAIDAADCFGNSPGAPNDDPHFAAHLAAAQASAVAAVAGLTGAATLCDVIIMVSQDTSAGNSATVDVGATISVQVVERY